MAIGIKSKQRITFKKLLVGFKTIKIQNGFQITNKERTVTVLLSGMRSGNVEAVIVYSSIDAGIKIVAVIKTTFEKFNKKLEETLRKVIKRYI